MDENVQINNNILYEQEYKQQQLCDACNLLNDLYDNKITYCIIIDQYNNYNNHNKNNNNK